MVSPAQGAGSALASEREVSVPGRTDRRSEESLNSCTLNYWQATQMKMLKSAFSSVWPVNKSPKLV